MDEGVVDQDFILHDNAYLPACLIIQQGGLSTSSPRAARTINGS